MKRLLMLVRKNFTLILRSKSSALIIILGPLLLLMLLGAAFNTANVYGIRVGVYSESYSPLSRAIIHEMQEDNYATQEISSSIECTEGVKNGAFHVCAIFPKDLEVADGGNIEFYVDNSKVNLVYLLTETISSQIGEKTKQLSTQLTKSVVDTLDDIEKNVEDNQPLVSEVKQKNVKATATLGAVSDELINLQLDHSIDDFPLSSLKANLPDNNSNAMAAFEKLEKKIEEAINDIGVAASVRKRSVDSINVLALDANTNRLALTKIEVLFVDLKNNVRSVQETGVGGIVNPVKADIKPITLEKTHLNFIFPTLLMMVIMFVAILLSSTLEVREHTGKVYFKNFITPTSDVAFVASNFITNICVILLQLVILLSGAYFYFRENFFSILPLLGGSLLLISAVFILIGICLGHLFRSEETNAIASISTGFIFLFFSSAILPIETLPVVIGKIAVYNPFFIGETLLNKVLLFQSSFSVVKEQILLLGAYVLGLAVIALIVKKIAKRRQ